MYITTRPIPKLPNHFRINIKKPILSGHEFSQSVEIISINNFYMDICTIAELRILEMIDDKYICAIEDEFRCAFCLGRNNYDEFMDAEVITLFSLLATEPN
jgi:hypothetical protein